MMITMITIIMTMTIMMMKARKKVDGFRETKGRQNGEDEEI